MSVELRPEHERRAAFVAMVAHELRTPLTAVHGALELMAGTGPVAGGAASTPAELVELARRNTTRLLRLVEDCLDLQAAQDGTLQLTRSPVAPAVLLALTVADVERSRRGGTPVEQHCDAELRVDADPARLARALAHLVENACSFAPQGTSVVVIATEDRARGRVRFTVEDHGVGFPADRAPGYFSGFATEDTPGRRCVSGLGIGLALVRAIAEWHDGEVGAESEGGRTRFWIEMPGSATRT
jgi:signal transduction histidine kinase